MSKKSGEKTAAPSSKEISENGGQQGAAMTSSGSRPTLSNTSLGPEERRGSKGLPPAVKDTISRLARLYHLSEKKLRHLYEAFQIFDKNSDGSVTMKEIDDVMQSLGFSVSEDELESVINKVDSNRNGSIEFEEFLRLMFQHLADSANDAADDIRHAFDIFDRDKDGYISAVELSMVMESIGEKMSETDIKNLMREADKDGDGRVNFEEFQAMLKDDAKPADETNL